MYLVEINQKKKRSKKRKKKVKETERERERKETKGHKLIRVIPVGENRTRFYISFSRPFNILPAKRNRFTKIIRADGE